MRLEIALWPDPVLLRGTQPVKAVDAELRAIVAEMRRVMFELRGVGLAAPQVGVSKRLMLVCPSGQPGEEQVLINPVLTPVPGVLLGEEGCLSFPGVYGDVPRAPKVNVRFSDLDGRVQELALEGFIARIVQHEADHLDGKVFIDRMTPEDRAQAEPLLAELRARFEASGPR